MPIALRQSDIRKLDDKACRLTASNEDVFRLEATVHDVARVWIGERFKTLVKKRTGFPFSDPRNAVLIM